MTRMNTNDLDTLIASRGGFIKETVKEKTAKEETVKSDVRIDTTQKALLNRKGNMLFNEGNIEGARRIFITTGYSDGLSRIGDYYKKQGRVIDALQMYRIAPNKKKADDLTMHIALLIKSILADSGPLSRGAVYGN